MRKICLVCALALALAGAECSPYLRLATIGAKSALNQIEDENIKATEVSCKDDIITYEYVFKNSQNIDWEAIADEYKKEFTSTMKELLVEDFCSDQNTLMVLQKAKSIVMNYRIPNGALFSKVELTAKDCEK
ncbi:polyphosphate kinase [uncultured Campylobacter sp.]|uniref:polyphosphate kinase n=1 Tax=uncultured Campylobacter sp. TaxID=218934 RepID=UPI0026325F44|nr:polyphosphate kinase [uncultured Campylobacter sp.]